MPFTAKIDGQNINILMEKDPEVFRHKDLRCKVCDSRMLLVSGKLVRSHFRHEVEANCSGSEPESEKHLDLKAKVYEAAKKIWENVELEAVINLEKGRLEADVLINNKIVIECQVSNCALSYVISKNDKYREQGLIPVWLFYTEEVFNREYSFRLNSVMKAIFLQNVGDPYGLMPSAFYYHPKHGVILPYFDRIKEDSEWSETGYINKYQLDSLSQQLSMDDFVQRLEFYSEIVHN